MKAFVFVGIFVTLVLGGCWGFRQWVSTPSDSAVAESESDVSREPAKAPAQRATGAPTAGTLAPGQVPGPRDESPYTPPTTSGSASGSAQPPMNQELNEAGFPKFNNTGPDGRFNTGQPAVGADGRENPDPFPEPPPGSPETNAYSDLPPPPPPRIAEDGYDQGSSPSFPGDPAFNESENY